MSRVHIGSIQTIREEDDPEQSGLSTQALAEHERQHPALAKPRVQRGRRGTLDMNSSDKSSEAASSNVQRYKINKRAMDVTRRLSMSSAMFSQLTNIMTMQDGRGPTGEIKFENTYRMEPVEDERFSPREVSEIAERALRGKLNDVVYDPAECSKAVCSLTNIIKNRIRDNLDLPRYKIVVNVVIGQKMQQGVKMASRCLWNDQTDTCATATFQNTSLFAVATIHGIYTD